MIATTALAWITAPIAFATKKRTAAHLWTFALAEHESMLELRAAAARSESPERRAQYLRHALDEERHAAVFARHASELAKSAGLAGYGHPRTDCEGLYERLGEAKFLAFVHRGELRGMAQFRVYRALFARRKDDKLRALFAALLPDEQGHADYTRSLLTEIAGEGGAKRALFTIALWEGGRTWRRAGSGLARLTYAITMFLLYVCLAPFALFVRFARPGTTGARGWRD